MICKKIFNTVFYSAIDFVLSISDVVLKCDSVSILTKCVSRSVLTFDIETR